MSFVERNLPQLRDDENLIACVAHAESEVAAAEEAATEANAAAAEAGNAVSAAQDDASELRAELERARAERDTGGAPAGENLCARIARGALSLRKGRRRRLSELETVSSACAASVSG